MPTSENTTASGSGGKRGVLSAVSFFACLIVGLYIGLPVFDYGFKGLPLLLLISSAAASGILFSDKSGASAKSPFTRIYMGIIAIAALYLFLLPVFTTWALFRADGYHELLGEVKVGSNFSEDVAPISTEKIRIVDQDVAHRVGDKVLGAKPSLGSQTKLGTFRLQKVKDKLYWVSPLEHSGFFKWLKNSSGTPGYVMVSATNVREVKLVQDVGNKPVKIKYLNSAFGLDNLERHLCLNGYLTVGKAEYVFEIDDEGKPYWVVALYDKEIGFSGDEVFGVAVVDCETGEINEYSIDEAPKWIDRIQPANIVKDQLDYWGEYVLGYWNLSNEQKLTTTSGISLVYGADDKSYWYTSLTSVGKDNSTVGFVLVDTRTKETKWYKQIGATEQAAQTSATGKVQEKGYVASFPITYNINGIPTYVMSLKDRAGLIKMMAMVSVQDYTIVGVGNNLKESLRSYKNALNSSGNSIKPTGGKDELSASGKLIRFAADVSSGNTYYYMIIEGHEERIFVGSSQISNELPLSKAGDSVKVEFDEAGSQQVDISGFDNVMIQTDGKAKTPVADNAEAEQEQPVEEDSEE